jgi:hypothetical protein
VLHRHLAGPDNRVRPDSKSRKAWQAPLQAVTLVDLFAAGDAAASGKCLHIAFVCVDDSQDRTGLIEVVAADLAGERGRVIGELVGRGGEALPFLLHRGGRFEPG